MAKGLGRGLEGLFEENSITDLDGINEKELIYVKITSIEPNKEQPRKAFDKQKLDELAFSVAEHGILQPIIVKKAGRGRYRIISGERRWRAAKLAGVMEVPVIIRDIDEKTSFEIGLIENLQREDLNIVEEAKGYKTLIDEFSMTQEQVAERVGKSRPVIANSMRILALPDEILDMVLDGQLTSGHARALLPMTEKSGNVSELIKTAKQIVSRGLTVRDVEQMARPAKRTLKKVKKDDPKEIYIKEIEDNISREWSRKVKITENRTKKGIKGQIILEYYGDDDFNELISALLNNSDAE